MAIELKNLLRKRGSSEATLASQVLAGQWFFATDTRRIGAKHPDGVTLDYFWPASRLADTGTTYGTNLIGTPGITGVTPSGGSSGAAGTLQAMLSGGFSGAGNTNFLATTPASSTRNTLQPSGDFIGLRLKNNASQTNEILRIETSGAVRTSYVDASGHWYTNYSNAGGTNIIGVGNGDNTNAASHAQFLANVGGGSGGDPRFTAQVSGGGAMSIGIDNSASDAAVWSYSTALGTSNLISSNASAMTITPAVTLSSTLGVTGLTTATGGIVSGSDLSLYRSNATSSVQISGGNTSSNGANIFLHGGAHATLPGVFYIRQGSTNRYEIDASGNHTITGPVTFANAPVFSSVTASQFLLVDGSKALTSVAGTGSGSVVRATSPTISGLTLSGTTATGLTASRTLITDGSGNMSVNTETGTGSHVRATSPTLTTPAIGAATGTSLTLSGLTGTGTRLVHASAAGALGAGAATIAGAYTWSDAATFGSTVTMSSAVSGTYLLATLQNTSNNAGAGAKLLIAAGGTSATGGAMVQFDNGTDRVVSTGWNQNTDKYTIAMDSEFSGNGGAFEALTIDYNSLNVEVHESLIVSGDYIRAPSVNGTPSGVADRMLWYDSAGGHLCFRQNGVTIEIT